MRRKPITWQLVNRIDYTVADLSRFELRPDRGYVWLQKVLFWILRCIGAHHTPTVTTYTYSPQKADKLLKTLAKQHKMLLELLDDRAGALRILIGPEQERELMEVSEFRNMLPTTVNGEVEVVGPVSGRRIYDIPITVIPWMQGVLIVPN